MAALATAPAQANASLAAWLRAERPRLNARLRRAAAQHPLQPGDALLAAVVRWLNPVAPWAQRRSHEALLDALFDLVCLHAGRRILGRSPGLVALLTALTEDTPLRELAAQAPRRLPAALSNAVERMGPLGLSFVREMSACAAASATAAQLLRAGAVVAWRLGGPRMRGASLRVATELPAGVALAALGLGDWPEAAWPLALTSLQRDAWTHPRATVSAETLRAVERNQLDAAALAELRARVGRRRLAPIERWQRRPPVGDFTGFGGRFAAPPTLLSLESRHTLYAEVHSQPWRIEVDLFGARCNTCAMEEVPGFSASAPLAAEPPSALVSELKRLERSFNAGGGTALLACDGFIAMSLESSHRLQVLVPPAEAV